MNINFRIKLITKVLLLLTILCIFSSVSCKKESELTIKTDTTFISIAKNQKTINSLDFYIIVTIYDSYIRNYELVDADLKINYDTFSFSGHLDPKVNMIPLRESSAGYNIEVSKNGYNTFSTVIQLNDIKNWSDKPYVVVLN